MPSCGSAARQGQPWQPCRSAEPALGCIPPLSRSLTRRNHVCSIQGFGSCCCLLHCIPQSAALMASASCCTLTMFGGVLLPSRGGMVDLGEPAAKGLLWWLGRSQLRGAWKGQILCFWWRVDTSNLVAWGGDDNC